jgi:hydrogenase small subunit
MTRLIEKENAMATNNPTDPEEIIKGGLNRRQFIKYAGMMTAILALPKTYTGMIAEAIASAPRVPVVWLEFQDCTGDSESFIRASRHADLIQNGVLDPTITEILLDKISLNYHETLMVPSGGLATKSLTDTLSKYSGKYVCIVEGSIPTGLGGAYCTIGGKTALSIANEVCSHAMACMALGSCAYDGGVAAAAPNLTGAVGLGSAVPGAPNLINFPGCPSNVVNVVAAIVYFLTFGKWPELDARKRPYFAYGQIIHNNCERRPYYDTGKYVMKWGDADHIAGHCLYMMGCKGPATGANCFSAKWNDGTNWPIGAGHGCIGCTTDHFWDNLPPVYDWYIG